MIYQIEKKKNNVVCLEDIDAECYFHVENEPARVYLKPFESITLTTNNILDPEKETTLRLVVDLFQNILTCLEHDTKVVQVFLKEGCVFSYEGAESAERR